MMMYCFLMIQMLQDDKADDGKGAFIIHGVRILRGSLIFGNSPMVRGALC